MAVVDEGSNSTIMVGEGIKPDVHVRRHNNMIPIDASHHPSSLHVTSSTVMFWPTIEYAVPHVLQVGVVLHELNSQFNPISTMLGSKIRHS